MNNQKEERSFKRVVTFIALVIQSIVLLGLALFVFFSYMIPGPTTIDMSPIFLFGITIFSATFGTIALKLAYDVYFGTENMTWLRYWTGMCFCYAIGFSLFTIPSFFVIPSISFLWTIAVNYLLSLVPAIVILDFTGLSDRT